jgi:hypothetical protein
MWKRACTRCQIWKEAPQWLSLERYLDHAVDADRRRNDARAKTPEDIGA